MKKLIAVTLASAAMFAGLAFINPINTYHQPNPINTY